MTRPAADDPLFATRWVHVFEEDTPAAQVYRPEHSAVPLSRRPRERLALHADGSAAVATGGADDRPVDRAAAWQERGSTLVVRVSSPPEDTYDIIEHSADRLLVRRP